MDNQLQQIIASVPAWRSAQDVQVERLAGLTNTNYRVTVDGERYVLRLSGNNTERLGINRAHEAAALLAAAAAGIGPEVVAFVQPGGHLVTRWIDGRYWTASEFRIPERVCLLTSTARRIHALPPTGATFSPFRRVEAFLATASSLAVPLPPSLAACLETMRAVEAEQRRDDGPWLRFCHNDLVSVNYLYVEQAHCLKVFDWEFSGLGDLYYDLAGIVYTHDSDGPLPPDLEETMLASYFGTVTDWHRRRLLGMKYMLLLFSGLWGLAQFGMQQKGLIPPPAGFDYLEFANEVFARDLRELQARYQGAAIPPR